ncbi:MAG TPA: hypothetical protein PKJ41_02515 [Bryobacteraceae bacterium]|nr:hypothetical protein [Bryobacteraceae bacterium]HPT28985.1 hypothetical protein [Bryobacteraceae bacterium]
MIDIHCHLLPGIDDGAKTEQESVEMMRLAVRCGTTGLVATPHADPQYSYDPATISASLNRLRVLAPEGLNLYQGCDFHLMHDNVQDALLHPTRYTINGGRYLLVEFSDLVIFENTEEIFGRLEAAGMVIVVTRPERNPLLRQRLGLLEQWVAGGRLMQVTAGSLMGLWGTRVFDFSRAMIDRGLVHFVASDGHDPRGRQPRLDEAHRWLSTHYEPALAELLTVVHPTAVIENKPLDLKALPPACRRRRSWFRRLFGRRKPKPSES